MVGRLALLLLLLNYQKTIEMTREAAYLFTTLPENLLRTAALLSVADHTAVDAVLPCHLPVYLPLLQPDKRELEMTEAVPPLSHPDAAAGCLGVAEGGPSAARQQRARPVESTPPR